jgi:GAF domain-containing protein
MTHEPGRPTAHEPGRPAVHERDAEVTLALLRRTARAAVVARRLQGDVELRLLQSVVDAAAALFEAEAASIAIYDPAADHLVFRVAAGARGAGVIGVTVPPGRGIVGHVFASGEAVALSDLAADPRFDLATARRTGYVPRSLAAVPLVDRGARVGVLQVLDKRSSAAFSGRDMELLAVFARQAAAAVEAARLDRDSEALLRGAITGVAATMLDGDAIETLMAAVSDELSVTSDGRHEELVDRVASARGRSEEDAALAGEVLRIADLHLGSR